jgi:hypothetical protein
VTIWLGLDLDIVDHYSRVTGGKRYFDNKFVKKIKHNIVRSCFNCLGFKIIKIIRANDGALIHLNSNIQQGLSPEPEFMKNGQSSTLIYAYISFRSI